MNISVILIIAALGIYLVWKLMALGSKKRHEQRRFNIRRHRKKEMADEEEDE